MLLGGNDVGSAVGLNVFGRESIRLSEEAAPLGLSFSVNLVVPRSESFKVDFFVDKVDERSKGLAVRANGTFVNCDGTCCVVDNVGKTVNPVLD